MIKTINVCWQIKTYYSKTENRNIIIIICWVLKALFVKFGSK